MVIKVVVTNKAELTDGRRGPLMTPFDAEIDFVIENIAKGVKFKTGNKFLDVEFLEKVKLNSEKSQKDLETISEEKPVNTESNEPNTDEQKTEEKPVEVSTETIPEEKTEGVEDASANETPTANEAQNNKNNRNRNRNN